MTLRISSNFDGGNIDCIALNGPQDIQLAIRKDAHSDFYQWFYFRLSGAAGVPCKLTITNCASSAYPGGWPDYHARVSEDRVTWRQASTSYHAGQLTIDYTPDTGSAWFAYFAPYSMERHQDLLADLAQHEGVSVEVLGSTLDGQDIDLVRFAPLAARAPARNIWVIARQHPGEAMAQWCAEGVLDRLLDLDDPVIRKLRQACSFYVVPNMNPDGSRRGHLRTNAAGINLNREWANPTLEKSPEVFHVLRKMTETGCDFNLDLHGDESIPHNFIAGFDGIPSLCARQTQLLKQYKAALARLSPDFQTHIGYEQARPGQANMSMSTNALAERFGCLAMTLEMPFKDANDNPEPVCGWSPERSRHLGRACLDALLDVLPDLR
jgi:murein tripeptide amidase MpaA